MAICIFTQSEADWPLQDQASHVANTGRMVEEIEIKMRNVLQEVRPSAHTTNLSG